MRGDITLAALDIDPVTLKPHGSKFLLSSKEQILFAPSRNKFISFMKIPGYLLFVDPYATPLSPRFVIPCKDDRHVSFD